MKNKNIEQIFGGVDADAQNALRHIIKERGYDYFATAPKTTLAVRILEDLQELGYDIVKK